MRSPGKVVREMWGNWDISRGAWWGGTTNVLRSFFNGSILHRRPRADRTEVTYDLTRALYRNDVPEYSYGAGFVRPIIDTSVDYMGLPSVSGDEEDFLNKGIRDYWAPAIQQMFRDAMRDSKVVIRYYQPRIDNPLFTATDKDYGCIEIIPPEEVEFTFDPIDKNLVLQAVVTHWLNIDDRTEQEVRNGVPPRMTVHEVTETVTPEMYRFYDKALGKELTTWTTRNVWNFVPLWPAWNEYAADLGGGQSDLEPVIDFIRAFHDVVLQTLDAHEYHSIPKAKFTVKSVEGFVANNWPNAVDPDTKKIIDGAKIDWKGREILFFAPDEDADFIEAVSVVGDSAVLLAFIIECIAIASSTPRWALLANDAVVENSASVERFKKKIERKRTAFHEPLVMIFKMALVANGKTPNTPRLNWQPVSIADLISKGQSFQQFALGFDVSTAHEWMSDKTVVKILSIFFPEMAEPDIEMTLAANNKVVAAAPAPASPTQALPPASAKSNGTSKNGKAAVTKALTTTTASKS